mgnify:CR=1 FL=1
MTEVFKTGFNTVGRSKWKMMAEKNVGYNLMTKNGICLFFILTICGSSVVSGWEEGDDAVNVISVENMDALLGLRMVTELKSFEGFKINNNNNETGGPWFSIATDERDDNFNNNNNNSYNENNNNVADDNDENNNNNNKNDDDHNPNNNNNSSSSSISLNETEPESEPRSRRMANPIQKLFPIGSSKPEEDDLCSTIVHCECLRTAGKDHQIISCNFHNDEKVGHNQSFLSLSFSLRHVNIIKQQKNNNKKFLLFITKKSSKPS